MTKLLLAYGDRQALPQNVLREEVKKALDEQWSRLQFGKMIHDVVPFLPLEPSHLKEILEFKIQQLISHATIGM
jgi:ATP-dependent Clp protease ATP-binding subunit ClpA